MIYFSIDCQDCGTVPREPITIPSRESLPPAVEIKTYNYVQDYLSCPSNDRVYAVSKVFLDHMCPLDPTAELHSATTKLPVLMPCQVNCPPLLGDNAINEDMLL